MQAIPKPTLNRRWGGLLVLLAVGVVTMSVSPSNASASERLTVWLKNTSDLDLSFVETSVENDTVHWEGAWPRLFPKLPFSLPAAWAVTPSRIEGRHIPSLSARYAARSPSAQRDVYLDITVYGYMDGPFGLERIVYGGCTFMDSRGQPARPYFCSTKEIGGWSFEKRQPGGLEFTIIGNA